MSYWLDCGLITPESGRGQYSKQKIRKCFDIWWCWTSKASFPKTQKVRFSLMALVLVFYLPLYHHFTQSIYPDLVSSESHIIAHHVRVLEVNGRQRSTPFYSFVVWSSPVHKTKPLRWENAFINDILLLNKFETVTINNARTVNQIGERLGIYEVFMILPSLRRLRGTSITFAFDRWPTNEDFLPESRVTEIHFGENEINANVFTRILTRAKSLERLIYKSVGWHGIFGDLTCISFKNVLEQYSARTLTHLDLDFKDTSWELRGRSIGSLSRLRALKHLRIEPSIFIDDDSPGLVDLLSLLPFSVETLALVALTIYKFTLRELRSKKKECLPNFREIKCEGHGRNLFVDGFKEECASVGIHLIYCGYRE